MSLEQNEMETWVEYCLTRGPIRGNLAKKVGLLLTIKANPQVETFMSGLAKGQTLEVEAYGDMWENCNGDEKLRVYAVDEIFSNKQYNMRDVSMPLLPQGQLRLDRDDNDNSVNLSFLKLVGISKPEGVTIGINGAYSRQYIQKLQAKLPEITERFLHDYIVPVTVNLHLVSQPFRRG